MTTFEKSGKTVSVVEENWKIFVEIEGSRFEAKPEIRFNGKKYVFVYTVKGPEIYKLFNKEYNSKSLSLVDESAADFIKDSVFKSIVKDAIDLEEEMIFTAIGYYYDLSDIAYFKECVNHTKNFNQLVYAENNLPCETGGSKVRNIEKKIFHNQKELVDYIIEKNEEAKKDDLGIQWHFRTRTTTD